MKQHPILYSFRRCPWAMRARYALALKGVQCELREVHLKNKPQTLLDVSPKGTVPVLVLPDGRVIDESLEIIAHAFGQEISSPLIIQCDTVFSTALHRYKYHDRYPDASQEDYRDACGTELLNEMEQRLADSTFLSGDELRAEDIALFPHIRQFSLVDSSWFEQSHYTHITRWLQSFFTSPAYEAIMHKHTPWCMGDDVVLLF